MKTIFLILSALIPTLRAQNGGPYSLDWSTIDGGGITLASNGGAYTLSGTIGQADAAPPLAGGSFALTGGFWSLITVIQTPEAPELTLALAAAGTQTVLSWDVNATGWQVEMSTDLQVWTPAPGTITDTALLHTITLPAVQRAFFRLVRIPL